MGDPIDFVKIDARPSILDAVVWGFSAAALFCVASLRGLEMISSSIAGVLAVLVAALFTTAILFLSRFGLCILPSGEWVYRGPAGRRSGVVANSRAYFKQILPTLSVLYIEEETSRSLVAVWTCCVSLFSVDQTARRNQLQTTLRMHGFRD